MQIAYPNQDELKRTLAEAPANSLDFIVLATGALFPQENLPALKACLSDCVRVLKNGGLLFVQGRPDYLPELGVFLDERLRFKYWIALQSSLHQPTQGLPSVHAAVLLFTKGNGRFNVRRTRFPHQYCAACGKTLKDWGGKSHLMHPQGYVISDVWKDLPVEDNYGRISQTVLETILRMLDFGSRRTEGTLFTAEREPIKGLIGPKDAIAGRSAAVTEPRGQYSLPGFQKPEYEAPLSTPSVLPNRMFNVIHHGDALETLKQYPDASIDLVFADPPYNLDKPYTRYDDEREEQQYISWCNDWLREYIRVLKPTGSLYVLNLPRWSMYHAAFLNRYLYFQNWIVWDALSEPRGKLMPAHYGLLFYTKSPKGFTFNYDAVGELDAPYYCLRASCIRKRKANGIDDKVPLTDIWWDVHRIKHKRDRDYHPCQLPDALLERIIRLSTNEGDVVLDALVGVGTTAVVAARLNRRYVGIDLDKNYVEITRKKLAEVEQYGTVHRQSIPKPKRKYTKKELQLILRNLANELGRLPTPEDVDKISGYDSKIFLEVFPTWGKALKAAKKP